MKSDQDTALIALKDALAVRRKAETAFIESPVRQSKCNGLVERAIRNWRDQHRTLRHHVEHRMGAKMKEKSALSTWLVSFAAEVINKHRLQPCGRTAFEKLTHHKCSHQAIGFGEKVYFQHSKINKNDYRKEVSIFLGMNDRNGTYLVASEGQIYGSSNVVRMPDEQAYDVELLGKIERR